MAQPTFVFTMTPSESGLTVAFNIRKPCGGYVSGDRESVAECISALEKEVSRYNMEAGTKFATKTSR